MMAAQLYVDLGVAPFRVKGGKKVHLVDLEKESPLSHWSSRALCGESHEWARSPDPFKPCARCLLGERIMAALRGNL